jgi:hypothetical protein
MNGKFFMQSIKNIIFSPVTHWETIASENTPYRLIRNSFFFPLIILVSLSAFMGSILFINAELSPAYSIFVSIKCFGLLLFTVYATAYILSEITNPLDLGKDFNLSFRIVVFSISPFLICQIFSRLFESLLFVNIIGFYGLYIFWTGAEKMLTPPQYKKMPLLIATVITITGVYIATDLFLTMIMDRIYFAIFA